MRLTACSGARLRAPSANTHARATTEPLPSAARNCRRNAGESRPPDATDDSNVAVTVQGLWGVFPRTRAGELSAPRSLAYGRNRSVALVSLCEGAHGAEAGFAPRPQFADEVGAGGPHDATQDEH